ncbi:hypothetical protein TNCV_1264341 [Trichonephila clavipes]|nr:hypothetical protein TNCV_1264341 [Trichonephila clavipes]
MDHFYMACGMESAVQALFSCTNINTQTSMTSFTVLPGHRDVKCSRLANPGAPRLITPYLTDRDDNRLRVGRSPVERCHFPQRCRAIAVSIANLLVKGVLVYDN